MAGSCWWVPAHLPVQSGSDALLRAMHRGYTRERTWASLRKLRAVRPGMGVTTDIIVGFPGETEADFEETLSLAREVEFDNAYIFKYSPRRDTPAASMSGQLLQTVKEERNARDCSRSSTKSARDVMRITSAGRRRFWWKGRANGIPRG